jgi:hypothetical protein
MYNANGAGAAKFADISSGISSVAGIGSTIITTLSTISDAKKRREFEQNLSVLTLDQQKKLERELMDANSESQRLSILTSAITQINIQRITGIADIYAKEERKKRNEQLIIGGVLLVVAVGAIYLITKVK